MKTLILIAIRLYWQMKFLRKRRTCLFRESCSHYVFRVTSDSGWRAGVSALRRRMAQCRPGYHLELSAEGQWTCCLVDGSHIVGEQIDPRIIPSLDLNHSFTKH